MKTILDGARRLLLDVADILKNRNDVLFVGGWGPYLRNPSNHPGTLDVDLLFPAEHTKEQMSEIAEMFLTKNFLVSAKHSFQLLKEYEIGSRRYIYNVDFLHPTLEKTHAAEFRDIIDLDITIDGTKLKNMKSICMPYGDVLFSIDMNNVTKVDDRLIRILEPAGVVFSKLKSCMNPKRTRDIFDILLSCREDPSLWGKLDDLSQADSRVGEHIEEYRKLISDNWSFISRCLKEYNEEGTEDVKRILLGKHANA
jgi:hypothetical protein